MKNKQFYRIRLTDYARPGFSSGWKDYYGTQEEIEELIGGIAADGGNSWQPTANEMLALAYLRDGKTAEAKEIYNRLLADGKTPEVMKARIKDIISVLPQ